jgi:hypothetical protein
MRKLGHRELGLSLLACGFFVGALTELVIEYAGG